MITTETPRTDAELEKPRDGVYSSFFSMASHAKQLERETQCLQQAYSEARSKQCEAEAEVERLRANLRRAVEIEDELETLPHQTADNTTNSMKKYWNLRAELDLLKATLNGK